MKSRNRILWIIMLVSVVLFCTIGAYAADRTFRFSLHSDGDTEIFAAAGDIITVVFSLENTASDAPYTMYAMQNEIRYDSTFFELVEDSCSVRDGIVCNDIRVGEYERELYMNFLSLSGGADWSAKTDVGSFQLRVIGTSGASRISCEDCGVSLPDGSGSYALTVSDLMVVVTDDCTVSFHSNGGSAVPAQSVKRNEPADIPADPVRAGYRFTGWYTDRDCTQTWIPDKPVTYNLRLYAGWEKDDSEPRVLPFIDVPADAWYYDSVCYVFANGLMNGISDTLFAPDTPTSRAMVVTILWRMAGAPTVNDPMMFEDVAAGQWYTEAIRWAASRSIVLGYSSTEFGVNDTITREQMAAILYRYAAQLGMDLSADADITQFRDSANISKWAQTSLHWAVSKGLIQGGGDEMLTPQGLVSRAQTAAILMRFCEHR